MNMSGNDVRILKPAARSGMPASGGQQGEGSKSGNRRIGLNEGCRDSFKTSRALSGQGLVSREKSSYFHAVATEVSWCDYGVERRKLCHQRDFKNQNNNGMAVR